MKAQPGHLDTDVLAEYRAGLITGRRRRMIAAHLADCARCAAVGEEMAGLSTLLAAIPVPAMPDSVAQRLDTVLAAEVARRDEAERAVADRPRHRARPPRRPARRLLTVRVLAPAAAVAAALAAGGYGLSLIGAQPTLPAAGTAAAPAMSAVPPAAPGSYVPAAASGPSGALGPEAGRAFAVLPSGTDYQRATLRSQLEAALRAQAAPSSTRGRSALPRSAPPRSAPPRSAPPSSRLQACVQRLTSGISPGIPRLVQSAHFQGQPAIVIVVSSGGGYLAWVVAPSWVGPGCSATSAGVLAATSLPGIPAP
jgi:hypothetical protein